MINNHNRKNIVSFRNFDRLRIKMTGSSRRTSVPGIVSTAAVRNGNRYGSFHAEISTVRRNNPVPGWKFYSLLLLPHCKLPFHFYIPLLRYRFYYFHPVSQVLCIAIRVLLDLTRLPYNKFHSLLWKASVVSGHFQNFRSLN